MDIGIGDFVRINNDFRLIALGIGKVIKINQDTIYVKKTNIDLPISLNKEKITKHSKNIIDLIEIGDFVNNGYVYELGSADNREEWVHTLNGLLLYEEDIKKVETHEQHEQNCYTVERS